MNMPIIQNQGRYMLELKAFCNKVRPFVTYYNKIINSYNNTAHNILGEGNKIIIAPS